MTTCLFNTWLLAKIAVFVFTERFQTTQVTRIATVGGLGIRVIVVTHARLA